MCILIELAYRLEILDRMVLGLGFSHKDSKILKNCCSAFCQMHVRVSTILKCAIPIYFDVKSLQIQEVYDEGGLWGFWRGVFPTLIMVC